MQVACRRQTIIEIDNAIHSKVQWGCIGMSPKTAATYRIDSEILDALQAVKDRDGVPISEQVRRALMVWLESKGMPVQKTDRKRVGARKRP